MKKVIIELLLMIFFLTCSSGFPQNTIYTQSDTLNNYYKIKKIEKIEGAYLIHVHSLKDNSRYTIVSLKNIENKRVNFIRKGKVYFMKLESYYNYKTMSMYGFIHRIEIGNKKIVFKENKYTGEIVTTKNISGLNYLK